MKKILTVEVDTWNLVGLKVLVVTEDEEVLYRQRAKGFDEIKSIRSEAFTERTSYGLTDLHQYISALCWKGGYCIEPFFSTFSHEDIAGPYGQWLY